MLARRPLLLASLFAAVAVSACTSAPADDVEESGQTLSRRGTEPTPPPSPPRPPRPPRPPHVAVPAEPVAEQTAPCSGVVRYDVRRATRTCEDLPGSAPSGDTFVVPAAGGHFVVGRLLAGTSAPQALQAKACSYTWVPDACAQPDVSKLLIEAHEDLVRRPSTCSNAPASCAFKAVPLTSVPPRAIPNGTGRCEVCGFAQGSYMWAILPSDWNGFRFSINGESRFVSGEQGAYLGGLVEVPLDFGYEVEGQDVEIDPALY
jgi:hypothetical protein